MSVQASTADGGSAISDAVIVMVGLAAMTPIPPTTAAPVREAELSAGACTFLRWSVRNLVSPSVELNGVSAAAEGA